jgi:diacylglycerol kinase (ATP)
MPTVVDAARRHWGEVHVRGTTGAGDATNIAGEEARRGIRRIIVVGGDGTVHEAANGLLTSGVSPLPPLGIVPVGTGNDFAKLIGTHRLGAADAVSRLACGRESAFDVGEVWGEYFVNSLGLGFDAVVASHVPRFRHLWRPFVYPAAVAKTYRRFRPIEISLEADHDTYTGCIFCVEIGIGTSAGGGFFLTPGARPDDGLFDVCLVRPLSHWGFVTRMPAAFWGGHTRFKEVTMMQTSKLVIHHSQPLMAHLDGEVRTGGSEMTIQLVPGALPVIVAASQD